MKTVLIITRNPLVHPRQMHNTDGVTDDGRYRFVINQAPADCHPDFVVINSKGLRQPTTFPVSRSHTILLTDEPYTVLAYAKGYCQQFGTVVTCQRQIKPTAHTHVVYTHTLLPWYVGMTWEPDHSNRVTMTYDDLRHARPEKHKLISVITSYKAFSQGHVDRQRFVRRLTDRFGNRVDVFGEGIRDFRDKWDVLAPYKYQIVIENCCSTDYWTEKLADCYLAGTYPLYHGCPNAADYFPEDAFTPIDIRHFDQAVETIERALADDLYTQRQPQMAQSRELVLDEYNLFNRLAAVCDGITPAAGEEPSVLLQPASKYFSLHNFWLYAFGRSYYRLKNKLNP